MRKGQVKGLITTDGKESELRHGGGLDGPPDTNVAAQEEDGFTAHMREHGFIDKPCEGCPDK